MTLLIKNWKALKKRFSVTENEWKEKNPRYRYNKSSIFQNSTSGIGNRVTGHKIDAEKRAKKGS